MTLTITNGTKKIERTQTIAFIGKKAQTTVTFRNIQLDQTFFGSQLNVYENVPSKVDSLGSACG